ncbi:glycosyltransferase family 2 protein [Mangrovimonas spongiae]|uniref:Glycosyltransferase family 2 protein n=1 Tax=Mangrovimonas spongiae TaxID=2494697 RepID=A0A428K2S6_9FLAO|nr:glycosyltransferase [Mangrovimonas spongiae]RSK40701.1 glycosyltransferase family 2 protein [Mangrovimonas spongiae]
MTNKNIASPFVSIIVPCYNVARFIDKGLGSVLNQTYINWECLVVNDGSKDNTENEIKKWVNKDARFKLISQENKGLSGARNTGLKHAKGDCIYFFDPDDMLDKNCLESLTNLYQSNVDIVIGKNASVRNQTTTIINTLEHYNTTNTLLENKNFVELALKTPFSVVAWNKLYNTDFITTNNLWFKDGFVHEDELWFFETMYYAKKIIFNSKVIYYYNIGNQSSITKNYSLYNLTSYLTVIEDIYTKYYKPEKDKQSKLITGTYILNFQITVVAAFYRFIKKNKNITYKEEGTALIKKHLEHFRIEDFLQFNAKKTKQYNLFKRYAIKTPEIAFRLIRNTNKNSILKRFESWYLKKRV